MNANTAAILGHAVRLGRPFGDRLEVIVRDAVLDALDRAGIGIAAVDSIVTCASDVIDGLMVPVKAEFAGAYGRSILNVPSSAGHALGAALTQVESGQADTLLLAGWGEATRMQRADFRANQADPFLARPIGATPRTMAALQAAELTIDGAEVEAELSAAAAAAWAACWGDAPDPRSGPMPKWAQTGFCDGAAALVLRRTEGAEGVAVRDIGCASRGWCPADDRLDPAVWVDEAISATMAPEMLRDRALASVEVAGPTAAAEARALAALRADRATSAQSSGGGAAAHFGPATGLRQIAAACATLEREGGRGIVADLAGPMGQHASVIVLEAAA